MRSKFKKPECPPKPPDLAQRVRSLMALTEDEWGELMPGRKTNVTQSMYFLPSSTDEPQIKTLNGSFDDLDIPYIDEDEEQTAA